MSFKLAEVVPWGRSHDEYVSMFALSAADLRKKIVGCGDGPSSFNRTLTAQGGSIVSLDPLYSFTADEIRTRIAETYQIVLAQTRKNTHEFVWETISSVEELGRVRLDAMETFLADFAQGKAEGRYRIGSLPRLPCRDKEFDLALCAHFLFLYSEQLTGDFHRAAITELCRVAREVRIFPLLELGARKSRHLQPVTAALKKEGYRVEICKVPYQFQKGGNEMLRIQAPNEGGSRS